MSKLFPILIFLAGLHLSAVAAPKQFSRELKLMGSAFQVAVVADDKQAIWAHEQIELAIAEIQRIERLISSWDEHSQTAQINREAGVKPVVVDAELFDLISRCVRISQLTDGAFDITFASIDPVWRFDGSMTALPSKVVIAASVAKIDYRNIELDAATHSVFLKTKGMRIGFGAIGKGYAANRAKALLVANGINSGVVNAGGDLISWGTQVTGEPWRVAISHPENKSRILAWMSAHNRAVVTSGDYERFVVFDGKRYAHIIDPRTGWPVTGIRSVTVMCADAELADALATAVFVLGREAGMHLIDQLEGIECVLLDEHNGLHTSKNVSLDNQIHDP